MTMTPPCRAMTETLLRACMLTIWFMMGVALLGGPPPPAGAFTDTNRPFAVLAGLGFGAALWFNTRDMARQSLEWRPIALLAFQSACGFTLSTDLLYLVSAEIPLVLPGRPALIWIGAQTLLLVLWVYWMDQIGAPLQFMDLPQLPHGWVVALTDIAVFAGHGFAFFMGYLAASEARGRRAAERLNAELVATRELLAQSSRAAERTDIARELHDTLGHHLVALKVTLELAQHQTQAPAAATVADALTLVCRLLAEVRQVVGQVKGAPPLDLRQAVRTLLSGIGELTVQLAFPEDLEISDSRRAHVLFRCVQEATTNALKHADARRLWVEFRRDGKDIVLQIRDDGRGGCTGSAGNGLAGMRERLEAVGGSLAIVNMPGRGFALMARLPLEGETVPVPDRADPRGGGGP